MESEKKPAKPDTKDAKPLPEKPISDKDAEAVAGGLTGPGTQTEDDIYVGIRRK